MAVAVELGDFERAYQIAENLSSYDFSALTPEDAKKLSETIDTFIEKAKKKELEIVTILNKKKNAKRFLE